VAFDLEVRAERRLAVQRWMMAHVFFKHEDAASGPKLAERFQGMV
jgi:hypothetical protein